MEEIKKLQEELSALRQENIQLRVSSQVSKWSKQSQNILIIKYLKIFSKYFLLLDWTRIDLIHGSNGTLIFTAVLIAINSS